ncbi:L,D-transpeptidase family protein [Mesorhizobium sp. NBSH29]|uniref:L,D-transpeptidase n=1 Tax=Mesorhizobium sp. NBSH29 TaxID=2654249 RepID=UPI0018969638|nr:L,D-transpeptidase [Mesorhizobium sp. NBSH29]QPC87774.1 L,D-transpeptidase family protein [Mesorhizobium sp. NBSH29]
MISRSLVLLGIGAALLFAVPSVSYSASATAAKSVEAPQKKLIKKSANKSKAKSQATASAKKKAKVKPEAEVVEAKKPVGLFAALFGPPDNSKADTAKAVAKIKAGEKVRVEKLAAARQAKEDAKAAKDAKLAAAKATERQKTEILKPMQPVQQLPSVQLVSASGNESELRSEKTMPRSGLFGVIFGDEQVMLPQTRALDAALAQKDAHKNFKVKSEFEPQEVEFRGYQRGQIVIDTRARFLYLIQSDSSARRYAIAVGREGLEFKGSAKVGDKQEWPRWIPTKDMQERDPKKYGQYADGMPGGPENPLGARAIYLYQGNKDTHIRIHGTNQPQTIGTNSSNGCFRMVNDHVKDLYGRVGMGTEVIVL